MCKAFGASLLAYWNGQLEAQHTIERDDGYKEEIAVDYLFKTYQEWTLEEIHSLKHIPSNSTVLDVGCGVGRMATYLQNKGHTVVGLDSCSTAISIAKSRGLKFTFLGNVCTLKKAPLFDSFDVILMMGNNFGLCGDIPQTEKLLTRLNSFLSTDGLLIFSCRDPLVTDNPLHLAYHKRNRERGLPPGLIRLRIIYRYLVDDWWDLLFVDPSTAEKFLENSGFKKIALYQEKGNSTFFLVAKKQR